MMMMMMMIMIMISSIAKILDFIQLSERTHKKPNDDDDNNNNNVLRY
jgi:uncharacterized membrane protein